MKKSTSPKIKSAQNAPVSPYFELFQQFENNGIKWCSWKSNEHLSAGVGGHTDLDILFHEQDRRRVTKIMHQNGFIFFKAPPHRAYAGITDGISISTDDGTIFHLHAHFLLTMGEKFLKNIIPPWNNSILASRTPSEDYHNIYISSPDKEAVLLIIREAIKIRWRDMYKANNDAPYGGKGFNKELAWTNERTTADSIYNCALEFLNPPSAEIIKTIASGDHRFENFITLRKEISTIAQKEEWRRMDSLLALLSVWTHEGLYILTRISEKLGLSQQAIIRRRVLPHNGAIVTFLGADGSGKSSVTKAIVNQWEHKIDVVHLYLGTGDGQATLPHKIVKSLINIGMKIKSLRGVKEQKSEIKAPTNSDVEKNKKPTPAAFVWAITGVIDKKIKIKRADNLRKKGMIVICDRWPQNIVSGINDGPLLTPYIDHPNKIYRFLAHWEEKTFADLCGRVKPDIAIKLTTSLDTALKRKPENNEISALIQQKINLIIDADFMAQTKVVNIDANREIKDVLRDTRTVIWDHLIKHHEFQENYYECFGLPGSGKTTLTNELAERTDIQSVQSLFAEPDVTTRQEKTILYLKALVCEFSLYLHTARLIVLLKLWRNKSSLLNLAKLPVQKYKIAAIKSKEAPLLGQLLLQNLWSAMISAKIECASPAVLSPFIKALFKNIDVAVFYLEIPPEMAAQRIESRPEGGSRFDGSTQDTINEQLQKTIQTTDDIIKATSYAGIPVIHIDATKDIDDNIKNSFLPILEKCA